MSKYDWRLLRKSSRDQRVWQDKNTGWLYLADHSGDYRFGGIGTPEDTDDGPLRIRQHRAGKLSPITLRPSTYSPKTLVASIPVYVEREGGGRSASVFIEAPLARWLAARSGAEVILRAGGLDWTLREDEGAALPSSHDLKKKVESLPPNAQGVGEFAGILAEEGKDYHLDEGPRGFAGGEIFTPDEADAIDAFLARARESIGWDAVWDAYGAALNPDTTGATDTPYGD